MSKDTSGKPDAKRILALVKRIDAKRSNLDDARAELGNLYQEVEDIGGHRQALKFVIKLRNMEDDKRNDFLTSVAEYCQILKIWAQGDLFNHQPGLPEAEDFQTEGRA